MASRNAVKRGLYRRLRTQVRHALNCPDQHSIDAIGRMVEDYTEYLTPGEGFDSEDAFVYALTRARREPIPHTSIRRNPAH